MNGPIWTVEALKMYVDALFTEREHHFRDQLEAAERAVIKAETALDRRLEAMNEIREQLRVQSESFATKAELANVQERFQTLLDPQTGVYARVGDSSQALRSWAIALLTAILGLMIGLIIHILTG